MPLYLNIYLYNTKTGVKCCYKDDFDHSESNWLYMYSEGNYACDCNRSSFMFNAVGTQKLLCGNTIIIEKIVERFADGSESTEILYKEDILNESDVSVIAKVPTFEEKIFKQITDLIKENTYSAIAQTNFQSLFTVNEANNQYIENFLKSDAIQKINESFREKQQKSVKKLLINDNKAIKIDGIYLTLTEVKTLLDLIKKLVP